MAEPAKPIGSDGALVKKAGRAAEQWLEPRWAKLLPLVSDNIFDARRDDARSFSHCVLALRMWFNGTSLRECIVLEKDERASVVGAISELEKAHGGDRARQIVREFLGLLEHAFQKGDPMPSKHSNLIDEVEDFRAVMGWLGKAKEKDIENMGWQDLNLLRSDLCDECFGRSSPLVKKMVAEEAQALLERIDGGRDSKTE